MSFFKWVLIFFGMYAVCEAAFVGIAGSALNLLSPRLLFPYLLLLVVPAVVGPLVYWARQSLDRPNVCAVRFALAILSGLLLFLSILAFSVVDFGLMPRRVVLSEFVPYIAPGSLIAAGMVYSAVRRHLGAQRA